MGLGPGLCLRDEYDDMALWLGCFSVYATRVAHFFAPGISAQIKKVRMGAMAVIRFCISFYRPPPHDHHEAQYLNRMTGDPHQAPLGGDKIDKKVR
jgi:hypothetical protein